MEDEGKKYWLSIAAFVLVFIAVVVTLSTFMQQTSNRIVAQANQYVSDATAQSCVLVSTLMENTQKDIETIAALASESADVTDIVTSEEWLISVEETSPFDTIDFVDVDGMQHSPQHEPVNVSDRSYFKRAMAGESGIEAVFNTSHRFARARTARSWACFWPTTARTGSPIFCQAISSATRPR